MSAVRLPAPVHEMLRKLSEEEHESMSSLLVRAIEDLKRKLFFARVNQEFAALRNDPSAWKDERRERAAWDATLTDGLPER